MAEIIDLTVSPQPEVIEISSDQENLCLAHPERTQESKNRKKKGGKASSGFGTESSAQPSRAHSLEIGNKHDNINDLSVSNPTLASRLLQYSASSITDGRGLFIFDAVAAPLPVEDTPTSQHREFDADGDKLLLPPHVLVFHDDEPIPADVIPPPKPCSDNEEYIEYLEYEDRKALGLVRYFEVEGEDTGQSRPSVFKCKNCGAEGDHKTYECPIQICLTCGARDEHSTRSCPISKTCYTCGMKGHINKTCPNRFSTRITPSDFHDCDRCGSTAHKMNECPTLWRIYHYVNDEERILILQGREEKKPFAIGEGGEGYIDGEVWCYNCANTGHLGDDCDELPHPVTFPAESSAFSSYNVMSGPFYDPVTEPVSVKRGPRERGDKDAWPRLPDDWDASAPPADVGRLGKNKHKERLEKRFREQEDETEDWFHSNRSVKKMGMDQRMIPLEPHGRTLKFRLNKDGDYRPSSPPSSSPTGVNGRSLLARLGDVRGGRNRGKSGRERREPSPQRENSLRIRGAAADQGNQDGRYASPRKAERERGRGVRDKLGYGGSRRDHGPRYKGGYNR